MREKIWVCGVSVCIVIAPNIKILQIVYNVRLLGHFYALKKNNSFRFRCDQPKCIFSASMFVEGLWQIMFMLRGSWDYYLCDILLKCLHIILLLILYCS